MLYVSFDSPFMAYDVAVFGAREYWAGEYWPGAADYVAGQGPGLFRRRIGSSGVPQPVAGSEARRIYSLSAFTRADGMAMLVGVGVKTADLFDGRSAPVAWQVWTPDPLYLFISTDGITWKDISLGSIARGGGPYLDTTPIGTPVYEMARADSIGVAWMAGSHQMASGPNAEGTPCVWVTAGTSLVCFDGWDVSVTDLGAAYFNLAYCAGNLYTPLNNAGIGATANEIVVGGISYTRTPQAGDAPPPAVNVINADQGLTTLTTITSSVAAAFYRGRFVNAYDDSMAAGLVGMTSTGISVFPLSWRSLVLDTLPRGTVAVDYYGLDALLTPATPPVLTVGGRSMVARGAGANVYVLTRANLAGIISTPPPASFPVLTTTPAVRLGDFIIHSGVVVGDLIYLGTEDGWILLYDPRTGELIVLARLNGPVLELLYADGVWWARTPTGIYYSLDGNSWVLFYAAPSGYTITDIILTADGRLFIVENNGNDSRVVIYDVSAVDADHAPVLIRTDDYLDLILTVGVEFGGAVYIFSNGANHTTNLITYDSDNVATLHFIAALDNENITATYTDGTTLWLGTSVGDVFSSTDGATYALLFTTGHSISAIIFFDGLFFVSTDDGSGLYWTWDGITLTEHVLPSGVTDGYGFLIYGDDIYLLAGNGLVTVTPLPALYLVSEPIRFEEPVSELLIDPVLTDFEDSPSVACYARVDSEARPAVDMPTYTRCPPFGWTKLPRSGRTVRVLMVLELGQTAPALAMLASDAN